MEADRRVSQRQCFQLSKDQGNSDNENIWFDIMKRKKG